MAKVVLTNVSVQIGASSGSVIDLSDHVSSVTLSTVYDLFETTQVGDVAKKRVAGLADNQVSFEFYQDFGTNEVEQTIYPLRGTIAYCKLIPNKAAVVSASNPRYEFEVTISEWTPLDGNVGSLSTANVTWPIYGDINKITT